MLMALLLEKRETLLINEILKRLIRDMPSNLGTSNEFIRGFEDRIERMERMQDMWKKGEIKYACFPQYQTGS